MSLTWKLLGAAESLGRLFSDEAGEQEPGKPTTLPQAHMEVPRRPL